MVGEQREMGVGIAVISGHGTLRQIEALVERRDPALLGDTILAAAQTFDRPRRQHLCGVDLNTRVGGLLSR